MLSINTNLSSLIAQRSMKQSTNKLNQAIERMTTGAKINHAKDNAANYSIATNMTTKLGALQVAEDNCAMGLDMIATANGTLDQIHDKLQRLRNLAVQASNGTYGEQSKQAINAEANALVDEIERLYNTTEYNGINLMKGQVTGSEESKFIKDIDRRDTSKMTTLASVDDTKELKSGTFSISTPEELAKLATMTNNGLIGENCEFVQAADIDLSGYSNWTPIGNFVSDNSRVSFNASFNGNGYKISNLTINSTESFNGLFGTITGTLSNINIENASVNVSNSRWHSGALCAYSRSGSMIQNCTSTGFVGGTDAACVAGLIAVAEGSLVIDCYSDANIQGSAGCGGGLIAELRKGSVLKNSYSTGNVQCTMAGGLVGSAGDSYPQNEGDVLIENSYCTGNITGRVFVGGIIGEVYSDITLVNSYSTSTLSSTNANCVIGGLIGGARSQTYSINVLVENSKALGNISASTALIHKSAKLVGNIAPLDSNLEIQNCSFSTELDATGLNIYNINGSSNISNVNISNEIPFNINSSSKIINLKNEINIQIGTNSEKSSSISIETKSFLNSIEKFRYIGFKGENFFNISNLDNFLNYIQNKQTQLGATENRLNSALDEISTKYENLVSSRSTLQDADIAEVSSEYIRQQILQQASATLLATANQSPSIALQLI